MRRRCWLMVALAAAIASCSSPPRDEARESLVRQLEEGGLDEQTAECVVDAFFDGKTDAELEGFFDRAQLTPEEAAEFAALGQRCLPQS